MKTLVYATCLLMTAMTMRADDVLNWTGEAGDGKWSTPGNWQENVSPKDVGNSETRVLVFPAGSVSENDWTSLGLKQMKFTGTGETVISGGKLSFDANASDGMIRVTDSTVTIKNEVYDNWASAFYCSKGELIFEGPVTVRGSASHKTVTVDANYGDYNPEAKVRFLGGLYSTTAVKPDVVLKLGRADDFGKSVGHHLESALDVETLTVGASYRTVTMTLDVPQAWENLLSINALLVAGAANVFCPTGVIVPNSTSGRSVINLNGFDQAIDRIGGTYKNTTITNSASPATLTMNATGDGNFAGPFAGALSVVWNPTDGATFDAGGVSTMTGSLSVLGGTFRVTGTGSFAQVKDVTVAEDATLSLETTAPDAFAGVESIFVGGTLAFGADANLDVFLEKKIILGPNGKIGVPEGEQLVVAAIRVNGLYVEDGPYSGASWMSGSGVVRVDSTPLAKDGLVWKNPVDGLWNIAGYWFGFRAPDGTEPQTVAGGAFTVTVPDETSIGNVLTVGSAGQSGVSTVATAGSVALAAGSRTILGANGRFAVASGSTLTIAADTEATTSDRVIDVASGGLFEVCGGQLTAANLYGLFYIGDGGTFGISSGRADIQAHAPSTSSSGAIHGLRVTEGGTVEVSGDGVLAVHSGQWGAFSLVNIGGTVEVKDEGTLLFDSVHRAQGKEYSEYVGGSGKILLSGSGKVAFDDGTAGSITFPNVYGDGKCEISVSDSAAFCFTNGSVVVGKSFWYGPASPSMLLTFDSEAENFMGGSLILGADGRNGLTSTMRIRSGRVTVGGDGFKMARRNEPQNPITSPVANVEMSGGVFAVSGINADQGEAYYTAFELGNSLPEDAQTDASAVYTATFAQTGGIVSNLHGRVTLGTGKALGRYVQSAGAFVSGSRAATLLGVYDGEGRWEMTGGTATFDASVYLGIGETMTTLLGDYAKCNLGAHEVGTSAKGVLDIVGGTFTTAGDVIGGTDGNAAEVSVGPAGVLRAHDLRLTNAAKDKLTIRVGSEGAGTIELSGELDLADGISLQVDVAGPYVGQQRKLTLLTCASSTIPLEELPVTGIPDTMSLKRTSGGLVLTARPAGLMIMVR